VTIFVYCYGRILHIVKRQKTVGGMNQNITMTTVSRGRNTRQVQQQETGSGARVVVKLSRTQLNVLKTMITVIVCFIVCWTPASLANIGQMITVCLLSAGTRRIIRFLS